MLLSFQNMYLFTFIWISTIAYGVNITMNTTEFLSTQPLISTTKYFTTESPKTSTTLELASNEAVLVEVTVSLIAEGIDKDWVKRNERTLLQIMIDSMGADGADVEVVIGKITEIWREITNRRRLLELVLVGVEIEYLIVINDPQSVSVLETNMESGSLDSGFQSGIDETFTAIDITVDEVAYENLGVGDPDVFLGKKEPTFGEKIASPYILLGIVCSLAGVIWLIFLQSNIPNNYPHYVSLPNGRNEVELVPQASAVSMESDGNTKR